MVRLAKVFGVQEEWGIHDEYGAGFGYPVKLGHRFMETVQMLENVGTVNLIEGIILKRIGERIDIVNGVSAVIDDIQINVAFL